MVELEDVCKTVEKLCVRYGCLYALIFGSWARREARGYSDLDVAVRFSDEDRSLEKASDLAYDLEEDLGLKVDVVPLDKADSILKYEVFGSGILVYCIDESRYMDDHVNAVDEYLDFKPHFERFYRRTVREIENAVSRSES